MTKKDADGKRHVHPAKPGMAVQTQRPDLVIVPLPLYTGAEPRQVRF